MYFLSYSVPNMTVYNVQIYFLRSQFGPTNSRNIKSAEITHCIWNITLQNARKKPSDPRERIHRITHMFPKDREAPFSGKHPVKPMATVTLTKLKEVCGGDGSQSTDEGTPSTEDLINMMKKKMMMTKKLGELQCRL